MASRLGGLELNDALETSGRIPAAAKVRLLGVPIDGLTMEKVLARVDDAVERRSRLHVGVVNAAKLVNMRRDPQLRQDVLASDLILADGVSVVWASRFMGDPLPERIAGIDLMMAMLRRASDRGYRVYCLGATQEILDRAVDRMLDEFPGLPVVGQRNGYFGADEEEGVAHEIAAARPDILFVAMTSPKKENFLGRWGPHIGVPVCHGVGGSFDVLAGKVQRAPEAWQRLGLEWLYRVRQEPRRLWKRYLVTNTAFTAMVLSEWLETSWHTNDRGPKRRR
jgi:N-acetylglucosaminyldiphosphoundecaprenol N-acetyl-beta-D-mannosaminyltransferase